MVFWLVTPTLVLLILLPKRFPYEWGFECLSWINVWIISRFVLFNEWKISKDLPAVFPWTHSALHWMDGSTPELPPGLVLDFSASAIKEHMKFLYGGVICWPTMQSQSSCTHDLSTVCMTSTNLKIFCSYFNKKWLREDISSFPINDKHALIWNKIKKKIGIFRLKVLVFSLIAFSSHWT